MQFIVEPSVWLDDCLVSYQPAFRQEVRKLFNQISKSGDLLNNYQKAEIVDALGDYTIGTDRPFQIVFKTSKGDFYAVVGKSGVGDCVITVFPVVPKTS